MKNIDEIILPCHTILLKEKGIDKVSNIGMDISRENGIDSLGIVTLILDIEDELGIELDTYLPDIRKSKTINELIEVIKNVKY